MSVEHIPWFCPEVGAPELARLTEVIQGNYINDGPLSRQLERTLAEYLGARYAVVTTSGTVALALALMGLGVGPGDQVIVPDLTFVATANAVRLTGAEVVLADVEPTCFTLDPTPLPRLLTPRTRALIAVDFNGRGCDYPRLWEICRQHGLHLLSDSAQALGSQVGGRYLGTFAQAGCFSFSANKTLSSGQGGLVVTDDEALYFRMRELKDQGRRFTGSGGGDDRHPVLGFNFKYTDLQAGVALAQFERLETRLAGFAQRDAWYAQRLADIPGVHLPPQDAAAGSVRQWMDILIDPPWRQAVMEALARENMGCRSFYQPVHRHPPHQAADTDFPQACDLSERGVWLPSSFALREEQADAVCHIIREALRHPHASSHPASLEETR